MIVNFILATIVSIVTGISQVLLKIGANKNTGIRIFLNKFTIIGYIFFFFVTILNLQIYRELDIKYMSIFLPLGFFFVMLFSVTILKEKITFKNKIGLFTILLGIIIFLVDM